MRTLKRWPSLGLLLLCTMSLWLGCATESTETGSLRLELKGITNPFASVREVEVTLVSPDNAKPVVRTLLREGDRWTTTFHGLRAAKSYEIKVAGYSIEREQIIKSQRNGVFVEAGKLKTLSLGLTSANKASTAKPSKDSKRNPLSTASTLGIGSTGVDSGNGIITDSSGNSYTIGYFQGSVPLPGSITLTSKGSTDVFVVQTRPNNLIGWSFRAGGTGFDLGNDITIDNSGNLYIVGSFQGTADFGSQNIVSAGSADVFVAKINSSGVVQWARSFGGTSWDEGSAVAVDSSGNVYVTGRSRSSFSFGTSTLTNQGAWDTYIAKFNSAGVPQWLVAGGGPSPESGRFVKVDSSDNVYAVGEYYNGAKFGSTTLTSQGQADIYVLKLNTAGTVQWLKTAGGAGYDSANKIQFDSAQNPILVGYFESTATFGTTSLTSAGDRDIFLSKMTTAGNFTWTKRLGGSGQDMGHGLITDSADNIYACGRFLGVMVVGSTTLTSGTNREVFVARFDKSGNPIWGRSAGGSANDVALGLALDNQNNIHVTGSFEGTASFGSNTSLISAGATDSFIWKISTNQLVTGGASQYDSANGVVVDKNGNAYITGLFQGSMTIGTTTLTATGGSDIFVAKYLRSGELAWVAQAGGTDFDISNSIGLDSSGNAYITGTFRGSATFGSTNLTSVGDWDIFVARVNNNGQFNLAVRYGGTNRDEGRNITVDSNDNVYIVGRSRSSFTFGSTNITNKGTWDAFVAKLNSSLAPIWVQSFGGTYHDFARGVAVDKNNNVIVVGEFYNTTTFGSFSKTSAGSADLFVTKLNSSGTVQWVQTAGSIKVETASDVVVDGLGRPYIIGKFGAFTAFGSTNLTPVGGDDVVVAQLDANGNWQWAKNGSSAGDDVGWDIYIDLSTSKLYVAGRFEGNFTFGSTSLTSAGGRELFVSELDITGNVIWSRRAGGTGNEVAFSIATDVDGGIHVAGNFEGTTTFGTQSATSSGSTDFFYWRFSQ